MSTRDSLSSIETVFKQLVVVVQGAVQHHKSTANYAMSPNLFLHATAKNNLFTSLLEALKSIEPVTFSFRDSQMCRVTTSVIKLITYFRFDLSVAESKRTLEWCKSFVSASKKHEVGARDAVMAIAHFLSRKNIDKDDQTLRQLTFQIWNLLFSISNQDWPFLCYLKLQMVKWADHHGKAGTIGFLETLQKPENQNLLDILQGLMNLSINLLRDEIEVLTEKTHVLQMNQINKYRTPMKQIKLMIHLLKEWREMDDQQFMDISGELNGSINSLLKIKRVLEKKERED